MQQSNRNFIHNKTGKKLQYGNRTRNLNLEFKNRKRNLTQYVSIYIQFTGNKNNRSSKATFFIKLAPMDNSNIDSKSTRITSQLH